MKNKILSVFISFAGCTSRCIYCNQNKITGVESSNIIASAKKQIDECLAYDVKWSELAFYGGSFTCLPKELRLELYALAKGAGFERLRFSTSPDCINEQVLDEAVLHGVRTVELGVQSLSDEVLIKNKRPYTSEQCIEAIKLVKAKIEKVGLQIMVGLHGDSDKTYIDTVDKLVGLEPDFARVYPCIVFPETELAQLYETGEYMPLTLEEAVAKSSYAYILLTAVGCEVIRIGLHDSESVRESALAGAYHPAMGDMAKTVALLTFLEMGNIIEVEQRYLNVAYGYGGIVKELFSDSIELKDGEKPDFGVICKKIKGGAGENYKRKIQEQTDYFAKRLIGATNDR
jgi:histone acetyltransferase (RNA polymerase elongator complex component)